jgi:3-oxoacyl-[acyl-carrier protein] reductase
MADWLIDISKNPQARSLIKTLGLPLPLPTPLDREKGPWSAHPLMDRKVAIGAAAGAVLLGEVAKSVTGAGADPYLDGATDAAAFREAGEAFGHPARSTTELGDGERVHALVFDASGIKDVAGLRALYDFFHPAIQRVDRSGRVIVLGRTAGDSAESSLVAGALDGFIRSVAKEVGRKGATANLVLVEPGAESRLGPVLTFLMSARSAYVSGQPLSVTLRAKDMGANGAAPVRALDRKVALVTGAARGIGKATARRLALEGAHVVCLDRPADDGPTAQLAREIGGTPLALDVTAADAGEKLLSALRDLGSADVVVHNAGITRDKTLARMKEEQWDQIMAVNLEAVVRLTAAIEKKALKDGGRVVCLSSIAGLAGNMGQTNYAASKGGVAGYVRGLSPKLAPRGITVNAIAPGFIETRLTAAIPVAIREVGRRLSALGQGGQPEDVAQAITFLASSGAQGLTGQILRVCGGAFIGA